MPIDAPQISIDPYKSQVPIVPLPVEQGQSIPSTPPAQGQFGRKGTGALMIGDQILKGFMQGHAVKEQRKFQQAQATIAAADAGEKAAYDKYQDALSKAGGKADDPGAQAAYQAYTQVFNQAKAAKAKFVMPEKPAKGQKGDKKKDGAGGGGFGGIKEFFEANPHIVPQIALMTMQPKPQGLSSETRQQNAQTSQMESQAKLSQMQIPGEEQRQQQQQYAQKQKEQDDQRKAEEIKVEEKGGEDAVIADKNADPKLQQAARRMKFSALDAQSPEGKMKLEMMQGVQSGDYKTWTPEKRMLAGAMGVLPPIQPTTITGKNGHQQQLMIDPTTGQPLPGSKPLDLGPPAWAQEFYAKRAADKADLHKAVAADPAAYGITVTADAKANKAALEAKTEQLYIRATMGIQSLAEQFGSTGYEIQRNNDWITAATKDLDSLFVGKPRVDGEMPSIPFDWPGGQKVNLTKEQANTILNQFVTDGSNGARTFRQSPEINWQMHGTDTAAAERDRQWAYTFIKNRLMDGKGKAALTSEQADEVLRRQAPALTTPIQTQPQAGGMTAPPQASSGFGFNLGPYRIGGGGQMTQPPQPGQQAAGGMTAPPSGPTKMYMVPGYDSPVELTDDEATKARAANIAIEPVDMLKQ
jgi:hypothetical protein